MIHCTARQLECLRVIATHVADRGLPPSLREIGAEMGIGSTNGVADHLKALKRKGYITRDGSIKRGLRITDRGALALGMVRCKCCGSIKHTGKT
jgi:repressor LexA